MRVIDPQPDHLLNGRHYAIPDVSQNILFILEVSHEPAGLNTNNRLAVELTNDFRNIEAVDLRKFTRTQFMVAVIAGAVMLRTKWDGGRIWRFLTQSMRASM